MSLIASSEARHATLALLIHPTINQAHKAVQSTERAGLRKGGTEMSDRTPVPAASRVSEAAAVGRHKGPQERLVIWPSLPYFLRLGLVWVGIPAVVFVPLPREESYRWLPWMTGALVAWALLVLVVGLRSRLVADGQHVIVRNGLITHRLRSDGIVGVDVDRSVVFSDYGDAACVRLRNSSTAKPVRVLASTRTKGQRCERDAQRLASFLECPLTPLTLEQPEKPPSLVARWRERRNRSNAESDRESLSHRSVQYRPRHLKGSSAHVRWFHRLIDLLGTAAVLVVSVPFLLLAGVGVFEAAVRWPVVIAVIASSIAVIGAAAWRSMAVRNALRPVINFWWLPVGAAAGLSGLNDFMRDEVWPYIPL
jgi:hypothetical protein